MRMCSLGPVPAARCKGRVRVMSQSCSRCGAIGSWLLVVTDCAVAAAVCANRHHKERSFRNFQRAEGGAVMPHVLITRNQGHRRRSGFSGYQPFSASALSTQSGVNKSEDTHHYRAKRKPPTRFE